MSSYASPAASRLYNAVLALASASARGCASSSFRGPGESNPGSGAILDGGLHALSTPRGFVVVDRRTLD
jgi:hypothetical protein